MMNNLISSDNYCVIVGAGLTGQSVAHYFSRIGQRFCVFDTRDNEELRTPFLKIDSDVRVYLEDIDANILLGASEVVISPGVSRDLPIFAEAIKQGVSFVGDVELFLRHVRRENREAKVVGITGSNGKTTVTTLVDLVLKNYGVKVAVGGNIGVPALDLLHSFADIYVLELSSFQLESIKRAELDVAVVLNVTPDHMDRYASLAHYVMAKQRIYWGAKSIVYNLNDTLTVPPAVPGVQRFGFSTSIKHEKNEIQYVYNVDSQEVCREGVKIFEKQDMRLQGLHNVQNAMALFAMCNALEVPHVFVEQVLKNFAGLAHRCEWVACYDGMTFINDSKATNIGASISALRGLAPDFDRVILIAGGDGKSADFLELANVISEKVHGLVLFGHDALRIDASVNQRVETYCVSTLADAVKQSLTLAKEKGSTNTLILLSPACASLDMFKNYEERGVQFKALVQKGRHT